MTRSPKKRTDRSARSSPARPDLGNETFLTRIITMIGIRIAAEWIRELVLLLWRDIDRRL
jgi:hypothetical protein